MKFKLFAVALIVATVFASCKKEEKPAAEEAKKSENNFFSVDVEASTKITDDFAMYYTEDGTNNFKAEYAVWAGIKGGSPQKIQFKLSEEIIPSQIRLDFGLKADQDSVVIKHIKVNYYDNVFEFKGSDFFTYFLKSDQFAATTDAASGTLTIVKKDGVFKTPFYYPTTVMIDNLKKITSEKK